MNLPISKTYLVSIAIAGLTVAKYLGLLDPTIADTLIGVLTGAGFASLKSAIKKVE